MICSPCPSVGSIPSYRKIKMPVHVRLPAVRGPADLVLQPLDLPQTRTTLPVSDHGIVSIELLSYPECRNILPDRGSSRTLVPRSRPGHQKMLDSSKHQRPIDRIKFPPRSKPSSGASKIKAVLSPRYVSPNVPTTQERVSPSMPSNSPSHSDSASESAVSSYSTSELSLSSSDTRSG
jgi:hypothetical protein